MTFQFSNPLWLLALPVATAWTVWLFWKSDVQIGVWRRWTALVLRLLVMLALCFAAAGLQWRKPQQGMTVYYMLDRSQSIPSPQQDAQRAFVNQSFKAKKGQRHRGRFGFRRGCRH